MEGAKEDTALLAVVNEHSPVNECVDWFSVILSVTTVSIQRMNYYDAPSRLNHFEEEQ